MEIGERLKLLREQKGLSLRELGRMAHVSHSFIKDIETGRSKPSLDTSMSLANALGVSLSELIEGRTDDPQSNPPIVIEEDGLSNVELAKRLREKAANRGLTFEQLEEYIDSTLHALDIFRQNKDSLSKNRDNKTSKP